MLTSRNSEIQKAESTWLCLSHNQEEALDRGLVEDESFSCEPLMCQRLDERQERTQLALRYFYYYYYY